MRTVAFSIGIKSIFEITVHPFIHPWELSFVAGQNSIKPIMPHLMQNSTVYFLLTPIELLSTFIVRPATLAIRLLANMIAGHMLLAITYFGTQVLLIGVGAMVPISALTLAASVVMTLFELFVAVLQAYVFTVLTAVYIKMSVEAH